MSTPTFSYATPSNQTTTLVMKPRVLTAQFGDGYSQRSGDGINNSMLVANLYFDCLPSATLSSIYNFLLNLGGWQPFYWTPPDPVGSGPLLFICQDFEPGYQGGDIRTLTCTFMQVPA